MRRDRNEKSEGTSRRRFCRVALGGAAAVGLGGKLVYELRSSSSPTDAPEKRAKIVVLEACVGCTGCVTVCPTAAINVLPAGISIYEPRCVQCGYCAAVCPVGGVRVNTLVNKQR